MLKKFPIKSTVSGVSAAIVIGGVALFSGVSKNTTMKSFSKSKRLMEKVYTANRVSFYCGCKYDPNLVVNWNSCGYAPKKFSK